MSGVSVPVYRRSFASFDGETGEQMLRIVSRVVLISSVVMSLGLSCRVDPRTRRRQTGDAGK
jgi:hypothetical protein